MALKSRSKVLVTGADGFIGSHLVELLVNNGHEVRALCLYNRENSWGWLETLSCQEKIEIVMGDICDPFCCQKICDSINTVFHLAALISIPYSYRAPQSYVSTNINGTLNMLEAARMAKIEHFIHTSTSEVYGSAQKIPIDESHPLQPQSPYSASKMSADHLALSYFNSFDQFPVSIARPFNTYGPRQSPRAIIPHIILQLINGETEIKLGNKSPTRNLNFVSDTCQGFIKIAETDSLIGKVTNIGSEKEISMGELFNLINKLMGTDATWKTETIRERPLNSEVNRLSCDNTQLLKHTGFSPKTRLADGLTETINWFSKNINIEAIKSNHYFL
jgi:NAD dependent epimerase/dehydratase